MRKKNRVIIFVVGIILSFTLFLSYKKILLAIGNFLIIEDHLVLADVIHVIAGDDHRTDFAIDLFQQGYGKKMFFTGGRCNHHNLHHGKHGRERAVKKGVPLEAIVIDDSEVTSTYSEVVRLKEFIRRTNLPITSVIVVSDPYHMWRARWAYRRVLGEGVKVQMAPVPFEQTPYQRKWWLHAGTRKHVKNEFMKILYYYARYKYSRGALKEWLASLDSE